MQPNQGARVLIVRGRTQTRVYHTNPHCPKLREHARSVKRGYAASMGLRLCETCQLNPVPICCEGPGTPCTLGRVPVLHGRYQRATLHPTRQVHLAVEAAP